MNGSSSLGSRGKLLRLIGIEIEKYACLERCLVPMDSGIRLLVGKNNSGKTALLRALEALRLLPFVGRGSVEGVTLGRYCQVREPYPRYQLSFDFEYDAEDEGLLPAGVIAWPSFKAAKSRHWRFLFTVVPQYGSMLLGGVSLLIDSERVVVLESRKGDVLQPVYNASGQTVQNQQIFTKSGSGTADGHILHDYSFSGIFSAFEPLRNTRMVSAHRVVRSNLQLQALDTLSESAESLAPFLDTILSNERDKFDEIQSVVVGIFPEFKLVNPEKHAQQGVSISLTNRITGERIPLTHCGTGVEQVLAIAAFVLTARPGTTILLDEPHSYLHPIAERQLVRFLNSHSEHRYFIATHSAVFIDAVTPDRILALGESINPGRDLSNPSPVAGLLHSLGYRNSDLLFNDRLILIEGESDQEILPLLLALNPLLLRGALDRTGFPVMEGEGRLRSQQRSLLYWERFLSQLGKGTVPRVYLFDGGSVDEDRKLLHKSSVFSTETPALLRFLAMNEIENYLLVPEAILAAMKEMTAFQGEGTPTPEVDDLRKKIGDILGQEQNQKLYPNGPGDEPFRMVKGSVLLELLFDEYGLRYEKRKVGRLIATKLSAESQPRLKEIWDLFPLDFLPHS